MSNNLYLKIITYRDIVQLFKWANDPVVRKNAYHTEPIKYEGHQRWFKEKLKDTNCKMYILTDGNKDYGQVRGDFENGKVTIDYSIDSAFRNRGYGKTMLKLFEKKYSNVLLYAEVKISNTASQTIFEYLGYQKKILDTHIQYTLKI